MCLGDSWLVHVMIKVKPSYLGSTLAGSAGS